MLTASSEEMRGQEEIVMSLYLLVGLHVSIERKSSS